MSPPLRLRFKYGPRFLTRTLSFLVHGDAHQFDAVSKEACFAGAGQSTLSRYIVTRRHAERYHPVRHKSRHDPAFTRSEGGAIVAPRVLIGARITKTRSSI